MLHRLIIALSVVLTASPAWAEVADKEPSIGALWAWALGFTMAAILLELVRPHLGLLVVPFAAMRAWAGHAELSDPYVGLAITRELGPSYVNMSYLSFALGVAGPLVVVFLWKVRRRRA